MLSTNIHGMSYGGGVGLYSITTTIKMIINYLQGYKTKHTNIRFHMGKTVCLVTYFHLHLQTCIRYFCSLFCHFKPKILGHQCLVFIFVSWSCRHRNVVLSLFLSVNNILFDSYKIYIWKRKIQAFVTLGEGHYHGILIMGLIRTWAV